MLQVIRSGLVRVQCFGGVVLVVCVWGGPKTTRRPQLLFLGGDTNNNTVLFLGARKHFSLFQG